MDDYKLDYYNIDISRVTLTVRQEDVDRVRALLGNLALGKRYYGGWINPENPSPSPLGFFIVFDNQTMYADFHNLPYYYYNFHTKVSYWDEYHWVIVSYVRKHPAFSLWDGQWNTARGADVRIALSNSFGLGGQNACLVLRKWEEA